MTTLVGQDNSRGLSISWAVVLIGFLILFVPTYYQLSITLWASDEQGHGPIILLVSTFLFWQKRELLLSVDYQSSRVDSFIGFGLLVIASATYLFGSILQVLLFEIGSQIIFLTSMVLILNGSKVLKKLWFPLFFLVFMLPLPASIVDALTLPMKIAVSTLAEYILYSFDFPIARTGVILQIGYYKLLVADACAGLHTVFTLEAMGLLYLHLIRRDSFFRNVTLATLIIPISFVANTTRVIILVLITYYYGDEVGQGFIHDFAGFVLFGVALVLIIFTDSIIRWLEVKFLNRGSK